MKVLHTADWHIGKLLYKNETTKEILLFIDWLINYMIQEKIDVLLISGDIFDYANPSHADLRLYYEFLSRVETIGIETVITGGNHDSVTMLNAISPLVRHKRIHIVGGVTGDANDEIIPIYNIQGQLAFIILAVPFLRMRDMPSVFLAGAEAERHSNIHLAVKEHYDNLVNLAQEKFGHHVPIIAMGHLFLQGATTSNSEREIHVGTIHGVDIHIVHPDIKYFALGHIHKPQKISGKEYIRYSGSPIYLDFSELGYHKQIIQVDINAEGINNIQCIDIPIFRKLISVKGTLQEVSQKLAVLSRESDLLPWVEVKVEEPYQNIDITIQFNELINMEYQNFKIISSRLTFSNIESSMISKGNELSSQLVSISPIKVFEQKIINEEPNIQPSLMVIYKELLEEVQEESK